jgi:uncharacterized membrane protein
MGRLFWLLIIGLVAVATHISFLLFSPSLLYARQLNQQQVAIPTNAFQILGSENQSRLFPLLPSSSIVGVCRFDLAQGAVVLNAAMPSQYWTLTIYGRNGKEFYSLNDTQSGTSTFTVKLTAAKSAVELLTGNGEGDTAPRNLGWSVESSERSGLAVFWVPVNDRLMRASVLAALEKTSCDVEKKPDSL